MNYGTGGICPRCGTVTRKAGNRLASLRYCVGHERQRPTPNDCGWYELTEKKLSDLLEEEQALFQRLTNALRRELSGRGPKADELITDNQIMAEEILALRLANDSVTLPDVNVKAAIARALQLKGPR